MRPVLAALLCLAIFGAVGGYLRLARELQRAVLAESRREVERIAEGTFSLEITLTFDAGGENPFALEPAQATALLVQFQGRDLLRVEEPIPAGTPLRVENVAGIAPGPNEFYVEAQPSGEALPVARALRVRVFRDGHPIAEQTLWSEPGLPVRGAVRIDVKEAVAHEH